MLGKLKPKDNATIPFLVFISFLLWFLLTRLWTTFLPDTIILIRNVHVHHFAYGIIMLSILSFIFLAFDLPRLWHIRFAPLLGIALASAYDEFAMWLLLENTYGDRRSIDSIIVITLILLNSIYFQKFWKKWGLHLGKLFSIIIFGTPRFTYKTFRKIVRELPFFKHRS
jgi:hypothetical protein